MKVKIWRFLSEARRVGGIRRDDLITDSDVFWKKRMRTNKLSAQELLVAFFQIMSFLRCAGKETAKQDRGHDVIDGTLEPLH